MVINRLVSFSFVNRLVSFSLVNRLVSFSFDNLPADIIFSLKTNQWKVFEF